MTLLNHRSNSIATPNNPDQKVQSIVNKAVTSAITRLNEKIAHLEASHTKLSQRIKQLESSHAQLSEQIIQLEVTQTENLNELKANHLSLLKQLADTLNSKKSSNLEPTLQNLTKALQMVGFEVKEQRNSQERLSDKIQQVLTAQQVMEVLNGKAEISNNEPQALNHQLKMPNNEPPENNS